MPEACFVTFESDDAKETAEDASEWNEEAKCYKILGGNKQFEAEEICSEPTDIIWENRMYTRKEIIMRAIASFTCSVILLIGSFLVLYFISSKQTEYNTYFPNTDCTPTYSVYMAHAQDDTLLVTSDPPLVAEEDIFTTDPAGTMLETYAYSDFKRWEANREAKPPLVEKTGGQLKCFCEHPLINDEEDVGRMAEYGELNGETA